MPRRRSYPSGGPKRQVTWIGPADQGVVAVASGASAILAFFAPGDVSMVKPTIVRTRGILDVQLQTYAADLTIGGAFGLCVVSDEAVVAGAASIPRPFDDAGWDGWFVWQAFSGHFDVTTDVGRVGLDGGSRQYEIDSKSMRKVNDNETVVLMVESQTGAINVVSHIRQLFKLA